MTRAKCAFTNCGFLSISGQEQPWSRTPCGGALTANRPTYEQTNGSMNIYCATLIGRTI